MTQATPKKAAPKPAGGREEKSSPWLPFKHKAFALLWSATLISNVGTWMHDVGAGWLMTTLDPSPAIVSLVQAATMLPIFLFALFAGALADRTDKRRFLIIANVVLAIVVSALAILTSLGGMTPLLLLAFTFAIGTGAAFVSPAGQAIVPSLVPREELQPAIALNSMGINISRAIGPALAGVLITAFGLAAPFILNAVSFLAIIAALVLWKRPPAPPQTLPPEPLFGAMLTGIRHASSNAALKATLLRSLGFFTFSSAYWALMPLVARGLPGGGSEIYGILLGAVGVGAVAGALVLPRIRETVNTNGLTAGATLIAATAMATLGLAPNATVAVFAALLGGVGWITVLSSLNISAQTALPNWVRARGLAISLMVFFGCMAAGSAIWGQVATYTSVSMALVIAAAGLALAIPLTWRAKLGQGDTIDLTPALSWAAPMIAETFDDDLDRGPVLVVIRYDIDPSDVDAFLRAAHEVSGARYRDGAYNWGVYQDAADPRVWVEWFLVSSWAEHLRQHDRVSRHDQDIQVTMRGYHRSDDPPKVAHYLAPPRKTHHVSQ